MAIVMKPVPRAETKAELEERLATLDRAYSQMFAHYEHAAGQRDALRDALAAAIRRERAVGGYSTHEDQQARRDAEALVVESGGKV